MAGARGITYVHSLGSTASAGGISRQRPDDVDTRHAEAAAAPAARAAASSRVSAADAHAASSTRATWGHAAAGGLCTAVPGPRGSSRLCISIACMAGAQRLSSTLIVQAWGHGSITRKFQFRTNELKACTTYNTACSGSLESGSWKSLNNPTLSYTPVTAAECGTGYCVRPCTCVLASCWNVLRYDDSAIYATVCSCTRT